MPGDLILSLFTGSLFTSEALNVYYVIAYGEAYNDQGTGSNTDLTVWRPFTPPGFYNLGYVFQPGRDPPNFRTPVVQELTPGLLAEPTGWRMNWNDAGSGGDRDGSFWTPICPDGYFALGSVAIHIQNWQQVTNSDFPDIRCLHCSLLDAAELGDIRWTDEGSGADMNAVVYNVADSSYFFYAGVPDAVVKLAKDFDSKKYMKPWVEENPASLLHFTVGDFDGDGKQDFISQEEGNPYANLFMRTRADDGFSKFPLPLNFDIGADGTRLFVGDFNGDKRDDFIRLKRDDMIAKVFLSDGDGTEFTEVDLLPEDDDAFYEYAMSLDDVKILIGDFNGDGKDDILRQEGSAIASVFVSLGNGLFQKVDLPEEYQLDYESVDLYVGDFNGDKKSDFLGIQRGSAGNNAGTLYLSLGMDSNSGLSFASLYLPPEFLNLQTSNTLYIGDFNGDGKDDFLRQVDTAYIDQVSDPTNTVNLFLSLLTKDSASDLQNDISTYFQAISLPDDVIQDLQATKNIDFYVGDFDKDGKDDLIRQPTNLRWDSAIANIYLSSLTADNKPTFSKLPDIPLRGDFTPLYIGDFNGDGKSDILKQEKGTWGDAKFSLPTIYLALDDKENSNTTIPGAPNLPFQKIYYRDELDASLIKDATTVKADMIKKLEYGLTKLGNVMGYYTLPWENSYSISVNGSDTVLEPTTGVCKFMSVRFMNWTFVFGDVLWGDALRTQQTIISTTTGSLNNAENPEPGAHSVEFSRSFTTSVDKYDLNTFTWNIGGGVSTTSEASSGFYSQSITFEINFNIGEETQTGTVSTAGETRTLTSSATSTVPPRSVQNYLIKVFGVQTSFDTSVVSLEARFSVMFSGGLRPDNYYNKPIGSDDVSNVTFTVGGISNPFYEALSNEIQKSRSKRWNWNDLMNQHPETYEWMRLLTSKGTYSTSQYFSLEAVEGTAVEVEFFPVK